MLFNSTNRKILATKSREGMHAKSQPSLALTCPPLRERFSLGKQGWTAGRVEENIHNRRVALPSIIKFFKECVFPHFPEIVDDGSIQIVEIGTGSTRMLREVLHSEGVLSHYKTVLQETDPSSFQGIPALPAGVDRGVIQLPAQDLAKRFGKGSLKVVFGWSCLDTGDAFCGVDTILEAVKHVLAPGGILVHFSDQEPSYLAMDLLGGHIADREILPTLITTAVPYKTMENVSKLGLQAVPVEMMRSLFASEMASAISSVSGADRQPVYMTLIEAYLNDGRRSLVKYKDYLHEFAKIFDRILPKTDVIRESMRHWHIRMLKAHAEAQGFSKVLQKTGCLEPVWVEGPTMVPARSNVAVIGGHARTTKTVSDTLPEGVTFKNPIQITTEGTLCIYKKPA